MTSALLATLPLHLVCNLIVPGATPVNETNFPSQLQPTRLPDGSTSIPLSSLSLRVVCYLIATNNTFVTSDRTSIGGGITTETPSRPEDDGRFPTTTTVNSTEDYIHATSTEVTAVNLPAGYVKFPDVHTAYKVHEEEGTTWEVARERCIVEGGRLAVTDSVEKVQHINSQKSYSLMWLHVGIHKLSNDGEWVRVDNGLPPSFIPWIEDNPDGAGNCAGISFSGPGLVDYACHLGGIYYVCEIPI